MINMKRYCIHVSRLRHGATGKAPAPAPAPAPALVWVLALIVLGPSVGADDWNQYLGNDRDGVWKESNVSLDLEKNPPRLAWTTKIGSGYTGPAVADGKVYLMDWIAPPYKPEPLEPGANINFVTAEIHGKERMLCLNAVTGDIIWAHSYDETYTSVYTYAIGPRATPLVEGKSVYALGAEGQLSCYHADRGVPSWTRNIIESFKYPVPEWGTASQPILYKDLLIIIAGGEGSTVIALDKHTGKLVWKSLTAQKPGYGSPVITTINGREMVLIWHGESVNALDPSSGKLIWTVPFKPAYGMAIAAPVVDKDLIYIMGFNAVSGAIRVGPDGSSASIAWGPSPRLGVAGVFNTPYLNNGKIYSGGRRGLFRCVDMKSGERIWDESKALLKKDGSGRGGWLSAFTVHHAPSGKTLILNDHGELVVTSLSESGLVEHGRMELINPTHWVGGRMLVWSHPAFANGRIFYRNDKEIRCWDFSTPEIK